MFAIRSKISRRIFSYEVKKCYRCCFCCRSCHIVLPDELDIGIRHAHRLEEMLAPVSVIENVPLHARSRKVDMLFRLGSRCHNERVGDINGMAAGITVIVAIERGDGLLFHLIALPVEDEVLEDGDGRCAHGFSFLPWGGSVAAPFAVYKYSRTAYQQAGEPYTPYILHIKAKEEGHPLGCPVVPLP